MMFKAQVIEFYILEDNAILNLKGRKVPFG